MPINRTKLLPHTALKIGAVDFEHHRERPPFAGHVLLQFIRRLPQYRRLVLAARHGPTLGRMIDLCRIAVKVGLSPIVRVADLQYALIARALDCGAEGVIFPRVEDPRTLEEALGWTKYPPLGKRGFGVLLPLVDYENVGMDAIIEHLNHHTMAVVQFETALAIERADELLAVPGIDAVMVGPADLSVSLGVPGQFDLICQYMSS